MAKKKVSNHQSKEPQEEIKPQHLDQTVTTTKTNTNTNTIPIPPMDEKLQNLKSLNSLLLKETHERRLQVEALIQSKKDLESELTRFGIEKNELGDELTRASDEAMGLELEKCLMGVFMEAQMGEIGVGVGGLVRERAEIEKKFEGLKREMEKVKSVGKMEVDGLVRERAEIEKKLEGLKREMEKVKTEGKIEIGVMKKTVIDLTGDIEKERKASSRVMHERDELKDKLGVQIGEANGLREKLVEMEKRERKMADEAQKQKMEYEGTVKKKMELESAVKSLLREKDLVNKNLDDSMRISEDLKRKIAEFVKEKNEIEEEMNGQVVKMKELENEKNELIGTVMVMRDVEVGLHTKVYELEKSNAEVIENRERMLMEFIALQEQKVESDRKIETLLEEKSSNMRSLEVLDKKMEDQNRQIEGMVQEKSEIEEVKAIRENEIIELQKELGKLRDAMVTLQETCKDQAEQKNRLESEISKCRHEIGRVTDERDAAKKGFEKEKKYATELRLNVIEMTKKFEESLKEKEQVKSEHEKIIEEKNGLERRIELGTGENVMLKKSLLEHQEELGDVRAILESKCDNSKWVLTMLKNTAALVNKWKDERDGNGLVEDLLPNDQKLEEQEVQPYLVELEAIKDAFRSKGARVEELKRQLEYSQNSVVEANKKKNFWTLISSATTLFVAASVAYVARGR